MATKYNRRRTRKTRTRKSRRGGALTEDIQAKLNELTVVPTFQELKDFVDRNNIKAHMREIIQYVLDKFHVTSLTTSMSPMSPMPPTSPSRPAYVPVPPDKATLRQDWSRAMLSFLLL